jgi:hypothetical protein
MKFEKLHQLMIVLTLMLFVSSHSKDSYISSTFVGVIQGSYALQNTEGVIQWESSFSHNLNDSISVVGSYIHTDYSGGLTRYNEMGVISEIDEFKLNLNLVEAELRYLLSKSRRHYVAGNLGLGVFSSSETNYSYSESDISDRVYKSGTQVPNVDEGIAYSLGINYGYLYRDGFIVDASVGPALGKVRAKHVDDQSDASYREFPIIGSIPVLDWLNINVSLALGWEF